MRARWKRFDAWYRRQNELVQFGVLFGLCFPVAFSIILYGQLT